MNRNTLAVLLIAGAIWMYSRHESPPRPERPVVSLLARAARLLLWTMWLAEPPPTQTASGYHAAGEQLNHGEGW